MKRLSAAGVYTLSIAYVVATGYFLSRIMPWWAAALLAPIAIQIPIYFMGLFILPRWRNNVAANTWTLIALLIGAAVWVCATSF